MVHSYCFKLFMGDGHRIVYDFWTPCAQTLLHRGSFCLGLTTQRWARAHAQNPCCAIWPLWELNFQLPGLLLAAFYPHIGVLKTLSALHVSGRSFQPQWILCTQRFGLSFPHCSKFLLVPLLEAFWPLFLHSLPHSCMCQPLI